MKTLKQISLREVFILAMLNNFIFVGFDTTRRYLTGFWVESSNTLTLFCIACMLTSFRSSSNELKIKVRRMTILLSVTFLWLSIGRRYNLYMHEITIVTILLVGVSVVSMIYLIKQYLKTDKDELFGYYLVLEIIAAIGIPLLINEILFHFGTQFVWLPVFNLSLFLLFCLQIPSFKNDFDDYIQFFLLGLLVIGLISTTYQFRFSEIVFGWTLWQILLGLIILVIAIFFYWLFYELRKDAIVKKEEENQKKIKDEVEAKRTQESLEKITKAREQVLLLLGEDNVSWHKIFELSNVLPGVNEFKDLIPKTDLWELVTFSKIKNKLTWEGNEMQQALRLIENIVTSSQNDEELEMFLAVIEKLKQKLLEHRETQGNLSLLNVIKHFAPQADLLTSQIEVAPDIEA